MTTLSRPAQRRLPDLRPSTLIDKREIAEMCSQAVDAAILAALRRAGRPVEMWEIGTLADISHRASHATRVRGVNRLLDQGLIRRLAPDVNSRFRFESRFEAVQEVNHD